MDISTWFLGLDWWWKAIIVFACFWFGDGLVNFFILWLNSRNHSFDARIGDLGLCLFLGPTLYLM